MRKLSEIQENGTADSVVAEVEMLKIGKERKVSITGDVVEWFEVRGTES